MKNILTFLFSLSILAATAQVGHITVDFEDPARANRVIQTEIYYPAPTSGDSVAPSSGTYPVIVFGHGFVMAWDAYQNIWEELVPQGYIMAFPRTEGNFQPVHEEFGKDLAFLANAMQDLSNDNTALLAGTMLNKTAIMGHSMGGGSTILAAANNTNIETIIGFAPAETNPSAIAAASGITVPALIFSADGDAVTPAADHHSPIYDSLGTDCKTFVNIVGGAHCYYANENFNCDFGEGTSGGNITITREQQHQIIYDLVPLWLDYYLKDEIYDMDEFNDSLATSSRITHLQDCGTTGNPTGVNDALKEATLLYPNPTNGQLVIKNSAAISSIEIYNVLGSLIETIIVNKEAASIDLSNYNSGNYFVKVNSAGGSVIEKVTKL